jgi:MFS family permease
MEKRGGWRNVKLLGVVSFLNDLSSEIILPVLPFFLKSLAISSVGIGLIGGIIEGFSNVVKALSGAISDISGRRKPLVFAGYLISQASKLGLSYSSGAVDATIFTALDRTGKGIRTAPRDALIGEAVEKRGRAFGLHRAMDTAGAIAGTILAITMTYFGLQFRQIILVAAVIGFLSVVPLLFVVETGRAVKKLTLSFRMRKFLVFTVIFGMANISYMFFILKASGYGIMLALLLYLAYNIIYATLAYPAGKLGDRIGKTKVLAAGYAGLTISAFLMLSDALPAIIVAFLLFGLFMALSDALQRALASEMSTSQGFGIGAYHFVFGISTIAGNGFAGLILQFFDFTGVFIYLAILSIVSAAIYLAEPF